MDAPQQFRRTIVIGAQGGIGSALVAALRAQGADVTGLGRQTGLALEDEASIAAAAGALGGGDPFDLIVDATGALTLDGHAPEKRLADLDPARLARAFAVNAIGPALLLKHFAKLLPRHGRSVFATLSARVGSIGDNRLGGWYGYRASKAALNQLLHTASIEVGRSRPDAKLLALHPNTVRTRLSAPFTGEGQGISPACSAACLLRVMAEAGETGAFLDHEGRVIAW